jgi:RimJ/RimL family protein N-acetyltransferase
MATLSSMLPLRSGDTILRTLRASDVEAFHAYRSDPELARYQGWSVMSAEEARAFIAEMQEDLISSLFSGGGQWIQLAIAQAASDELLGDVGLFLSEDLSYGEIGFTLCAAAHGQGHATRAAIAATELLFALTGAREVRGITDARNSPSARVLGRAGFEQVLVQQTVFKGEPCTELVYRRLR